jgi:hypothetical protein
MMDPKIKAKWIEALRSGEYKQAIKGLRVEIHGEERPFNYCCLGVLCDVLGTDWTDSGGALYGVPVRSNAQLDLREKTWIGDDYLSQNMLGIVRLSQDEQGELAKMNDRGISFADIADYIDKNL